MNVEAMRADDDFRTSILSRHAASGSLAVGLGELIFFPFDTLKVFTQVNALPKNPVPISQAYSTSILNSNFLGIYRGFGINICGKLLSTSTRFSVYEIVKSFYEDGKAESIGLSKTESFSAGLIAGAMESFLTTPFELITIRLQAQTPLYTSSPSPSPSSSSLFPSQCSPSLTVEQRLFSKRLLSRSGSHGVYSWNTGSGSRSYPWLQVRNAAAVNFMDAIRGGLREEGWSHFMRGFRSTLARDSLYSAFFFASWTAMDELAFEVWAAQSGYYHSPVNVRMEVGLLDACIEASMAAAIATIATQPFDTTKTRTQATVLPKHEVLERALLNIKEDTLWWQRLGGFRSWESGIHFHGLGLRLVRNSLATFCVVGGYFLTLNQLVKSNERKSDDNS